MSLSTSLTARAEEEADMNNASFTDGRFGEIDALQRAFQASLSANTSGTSTPPLLFPSRLAFPPPSFFITLLIAGHFRDFRAL